MKKPSLEGDEAKSYAFASPAHYDEILRLYILQAKNIHELAVFGFKKPIKEEPVIPLLNAIRESYKTIGLLAYHRRLRDTLVISRALFETIINVCFMYTSAEAMKRAENHAAQKTYRDFNREVKLGGRVALSIRYHGPIDRRLTQDLKDVLREFTSKSGAERRSWTPENVGKRIELISNKFGEKARMPLLFGLVMIYRNASEVLHGTYYGSLLALGLIHPIAPDAPATGAETFERMEQHQRNELTAILMAMIACGVALIRVISSGYPELSELLEKAESDELKMVGILEDNEEPDDNNPWIAEADIAAKSKQNRKSDK